MLITHKHADYQEEPTCFRWYYPKRYYHVLQLHCCRGEFLLLLLWIGTVDCSIFGSLGGAPVQSTNKRDTIHERLFILAPCSASTFLRDAKAALVLVFHLSSSR